MKRQLILSSLAIITLSFVFYKSAHISDFTKSLLGRGRSFIDAKLAVWMKLEEIQWQEVDSSNLSHYVTKELLWSASGLKVGQPMLQIDLAELEKRLLSVPWIESVQLQKKLPSQIYAQYTVHHARALSIKDKRPWLVSSDGKWIAPVRTSAADFPVLTSGSSLEQELSWLDALESELKPHLLQVHEVSISPKSATKSSAANAIIELKYSSKASKVEVLAAGSESGTPETASLNRLKHVVQYLIKNNILVSSIDLRAGQKVVVNVGKRL